jgi:hypothetical protein
MVGWLVINSVEGVRTAFTLNLEHLEWEVHDKNRSRLPRPEKEESFAQLRRRK